MNNQSISLKSSFFFVMESTILVSIGVTEAGLTGFRFNTIGVSDGISMGTDGMSYSLQSRDVIADSIETIMGGQVTFSSSTLTTPRAINN
jgi:dihydroxyacid dehydratase/phosphogluconate dehydratase